MRFAETNGELRRVTREIDPVLEVSEIAQRVMRAGGPALLFENIKGSRFPLLINTYATRKRMSWALGVDDLETHARTIADLVKSQPPASLLDKIRMLPKLGRVASAMPRTVSTAPCQEIVEASPDLTKLPIITTWPGDGGPYITLPMVITRDPDKGTRNVGCYRMQVFGPRETAMHWQLHKTGRRHMRRYQELGIRRMPVAVALGGDPSLPYAATAPLPDGIDEFMFAGFLRRKAVDMVACKTIELEVPASADFVLEGYVDVERAPAARGTVRRSHRVLLAGGRLPGLSSDRADPARESDLRHDRRGSTAAGGRLAGQGDRAAVPAAAADDVPRDRGHEPSHRRRVPQPVHRVDPKRSTRTTRARSAIRCGGWGR